MTVHRGALQTMGVYQSKYCFHSFRIGEADAGKMEYCLPSICQNPQRAAGFVFQDPMFLKVFVV